MDELVATIPALRCNRRLADDLKTVTEKLNLRRAEYVRQCLARQVRADLAELERIGHGQREPA